MDSIKDYCDHVIEGGILGREDRKKFLQLVNEKEGTNHQDDDTMANIYHVVKSIVEPEEPKAPKAPADNKKASESKKSSAKDKAPESPAVPVVDVIPAAPAEPATLASPAETQTENSEEPKSE